MRARPSRLSAISRPAILALGLALGCGCAPRKAAPPAESVKKYEPPDERFVFFGSGKVELAPEGYFNLGYVTALLDGNPAFHVLVVGHADQAGKSDLNKELSFKRARIVRKILIERGVKAERILIAAPLEGTGGTAAQLSRRADLFVYDPVQDEASKRIGYKVEVKQE